MDPGNLYTLITGASSGIGRALARRLSHGRRLILHGRDTGRLEETRAACANPERQLLWSLDLREPGSAAPSLRALMAENGIGIECFIHSAALLSILPIRAIDAARFAETMNVNVVSAVEIIGLLARKTVNQRQLKNVVLISSIASKFGAPGFSMYSASKAALDGLMRALAVELAPDVRVNSILPGGIRTPMTDELLADPAVASRLARDYPLGMGDPEDIVSAAEFLISDAARWITGQQMVVDGGRSVNISI